MTASEYAEWVRSHATPQQILEEVSRRIGEFGSDALDEGQLALLEAFREGVSTGILYSREWDVAA